MHVVKTVHAVLDAVLSLLATSDRWTRHATARDATGNPVAAESPGAVAWSLDGAIEHVVGYWEDPSINDDEADRRRDLELATFAALGGYPAVTSDAAGYENVLALIRAARRRI